MKKVLIANRGEIACRVIRSCREAGLATVAIHAEVDAGARHVALADEAALIEAPKPVGSYLDGPAIVSAALSTGADAVHPGYGFLSENAGFASAVEAAGLVFIGPTPANIDAMGDKERSRALAVAAGVPVLPGSRRFAEGDLAGMDEIGAAVGYPLLVKASGGGGGIGMRIVESPADLAKTAEATQTLAARSFNDGTIFLERYVRNARHVEVQVFGFGDGEAVHLFERECSIQRRFQKIVEESPSPGITPATREAMTAAALSLSRAVRYRGAGTVEFVVDADTGDFFFLEMNTRIQVEHPVTEEVTGLDLVALQLRLAAGALAPADLPQGAIRQTGHAIEVRLCAENPARMFLPSPGRLDVLALPFGLPGIRVETGVVAGDVITPHFDPMIAKIIAHGPTRAEAIDRLRAALAATDLGAFVSNLGLLRAIAADPAFAEGATYTTYLTTNRGPLGL
jgi:acetyl/propionyl-CoA carboxylase alpha subunit